jgi:hypothetical protein
VAIEDSSVEFRKMTQTLISELSRLEIEKIRDFSKEFKGYMEGMIDIQRKV